MENNLQRKVGRPSTKKPYRQNLVRVAAIEDWMENVIEKVPNRSEAKKILVEEFKSFINQETEKTRKRKID